MTYQTSRITLRFHISRQRGKAVKVQFGKKNKENNFLKKNMYIFFL